MNLRYICLIVLALSAVFVMVFITFPKTDKQSKTHQSFVGEAPAVSDPYTITDYTKPAH